MIDKSFYVIIGVIVVFFSACSTAVITKTKKELPIVYEDINETHQKKKDIKISIFRFNNYTDTPRAGMRASNIFEGILLTKGYHIKSHISEKSVSFKKAKKIAKDDNSKYFLYGGVSEWRYKTGIDGEPAVSVQMSLYKTKNAKLVWSATGSDSDWGNGSIGTTAHNLFNEILEP